MDYDRRWLDEIGTHDSCGRAIWSIGYGIAKVLEEEAKTATSIVVGTR